MAGIPGGLKMRRSKIIGYGFYVPDKVVTNFDLAEVMDTSDEWIRERTGIKERRWVENGIGPSDLAKEAASKALERSGLEPKDIDLIVLSTLNPDYFFPGSAFTLQAMLEFGEIAAIDVRAQCSGFIYSLSIADQFIKTGMYDNILVVGSEVHSLGLDHSDRGRDVTVLFGDGAGAVILGPSDDPEKGILSTHLHAQGEHYDKLWVQAPMGKRMPRISQEMIDQGLHYPKMDGRFIFRHAIQRFAEVVLEALSANGYTPDDLDLFIPHQANVRITKMSGQKLGLTEEKIFSNIHKYGNTTAASVPIALCEAIEEGRIKDGSLVCLASFGSGLSWASALIRW
jgi:3-oxoacyl-[acyl-carrier-protein] synthase-3